MPLLQKLNNLLAEISLKAKYRTARSRLFTSMIVLSFLLHAGNVFCSDSTLNWNRISGPIPVVNQSPIQLLFLQPPPDRAEIYPQNKFSVNLINSITNTLLWSQSNQYLGYIDMEMIRSSLEVKYGLCNRFEFGMSLPFMYGDGGFLDHGILEFEKLFNAERDLRDKEDKAGISYKYNYFVKKNDKVFIQGKEGSSGLGDVSLRVKGKILDEGEFMPYLSARASIKIPTGDEDRAFGSGEVDYSLGLLLQKTVKNFTTYLNADVIFPGDAYDDVDVSLTPFYDIILGTEYKLSEGLSGLVQLSYVSRPFEHTDLDLLEHEIIDVLLGLSYVTKTGISIQGGFIEDFFGSSDAGADVTFFLNIGKNF